MYQEVSDPVPKLPLALQRLSTDEYRPVKHHPRNLSVIDILHSKSPDISGRLGLPLASYWSSRLGTAAALRAINDAWGGDFYDVPTDAALDYDTSNAVLGGNQLVIDVQTHYVSDRSTATSTAKEAIIGLAESVAPDHFKGLSKLVKTQNQLGYSLAEYLRCVFLQSETSIAVLTSGPGAEDGDPRRNLNNSEMIGTRELIERLGGTGRLINHSTVHPNVPGEIDKMGSWGKWCAPAGWKCYTMYGSEGVREAYCDTQAWMLDDGDCGNDFLSRIMKTPVRNLSVHKGISGGADVGWHGPSSPRDIGPAAKRFPGINFLVYHSGYEPRQGNLEEGAYSEEFAHTGTNRLVTSLIESQVAPSSNVYAELGTTWYLVMANPPEAAHVLGKLLRVVGEDNVLWGTDSVWYGPSQPLIDAFRAFQIPKSYSDQYGYPQLTPAIKEKILGLNAARLYGIDPVEALTRTRGDNLEWVKMALKEFSANGTSIFC